MLRLCNKCKGAISVFLTLILLPTFIFGGVIVDGSRVLGAKNLISGAGDLAMNAALSNYYEELNVTYGLLAMAETPEEVEDIMKDFFETTLNAVDVDKEDFKKALIYLELTGDFEAEHIDGTAVYETEVFKQEVLEYMKYRAPVTFAKRGMFEKLEDVKDVSKIKNAAEKELAFEKELNDVQEIFDTIKENADLLEDYYFKNTYTQKEFDSMRANAYSDYDEVTMLAIAYNRIKNCGDIDSGDLESKMEEMADEASFVTGDITAGVAEHLIKMKKIRNFVSTQDKNSIKDGLTPEDPEYDEKEDIISDYDDACSTLESGKNNTKKELDALVKDIYEEFNEQYILAHGDSSNQGGIETCEIIIEQTELLQEKMASLQGKYEAWQGAVDNIPDANASKQGFKDNIADSADIFINNGECVTDFLKKIKDNLTYYSEIDEQLPQVTFGEKSLCKDITKGDVILNMELANASVNTSSELKEAAKAFKSQYVNFDMKMSVTNISIKDDAFVKLLEEKYCKISDEANESEANKKSEEWKNKSDQFSKELKDEFDPENDKQFENKNIDEIGKGDLPSDWLLAPADPTTAPTNDDKIKGGLDSKKNRKDASSAGQDILNADDSSISEMENLANSITEKLAMAGEAIVEPVYLTEYVLGMFSHYTSNKNPDGTPNEAPESINKSALKNNEAYRAEVEYILWGAPETRNNVDITKAIIFTANFIFNMTFAFTDNTIRKDANTVALMFPVGPLAKTAIKCALQSLVAMIESVKNIKDIMDGKAVPLLKVPNTGHWSTPILTPGPGWQEYDGKTGFTYEDYLWIFVCMKMAIPGSQRSLLARTADCVELNLTDGKEIEDNTLHDKYTMVQLKTSVAIDTFFLGKLSGAGYDVEEINEDTFTIDYIGLQGY